MNLWNYEFLAQLPIWSSSFKKLSSKAKKDNFFFYIFILNFWSHQLFGFRERGDSLGVLQWYWHWLSLVGWIHDQPGAFNDILFHQLHWEHLQPSWTISLFIKSIGSWLRWRSWCCSMIIISASGGWCSSTRYPRVEADKILFWSPL